MPPFLYDIIKIIFEYLDKYSNELKYDWWPSKDDKKYKSNSFTSGLLTAIGVDDIPDISKDYSVPGWKKPVLIDSFN